MHARPGRAGPATEEERQPMAPGGPFSLPLFRSIVSLVSVAMDSSKSLAISVLVSRPSWLCTLHPLDLGDLLCNARAVHVAHHPKLLEVFAKVRVEEGLAVYAIL